MYEQMEPVYGIAILEKTLLPDEESPINTYWMANSRTGKPLNSYYKDGKRQNLLQIAFLELDKYNKGKHITDEGRQWLEFLEISHFLRNLVKRSRMPIHYWIHPAGHRRKRR